MKRALINSFRDEIERIKRRGGIRLESQKGWFNCYNSELVLIKIKQMKDIINQLYNED